MSWRQSKRCLFGHVKDCEGGAATKKGIPKRRSLVVVKENMSEVSVIEEDA